MVVTRRVVPLLANLFLQTCLTAVLAVFAIALTLNEFEAFEFSLAAVAANVLHLASSLSVVIWVLLKSEYPLRKLLARKKGVFALAVSPIISYVITIVFLLMMQFQVETPKGGASLLGSAIFGLLISAWIVYGSAVLSSVTLLTVVLLDKPQVLDTEPQQQPRYTLGRISPTQSLFSPPSLHGIGITIPPHHSPYAESKTGSSVFSDSGDWYNTPQGMRSATSRTKLAGPPSLVDDVTDSSPESYEMTPLSSPVSIPSPLGGKSGAPSNKAPAKRLDTIPGSNPNSPVKPLGWPFNERLIHTTRHDPAAEDGLPSSDMDVRNTTTKGDPVLPRSHNSVKSVTPSKVGLDESHIHPLFRSDSPDPTPTPSPTTTVVASALGGKYITSRELARVRALSNASSAHSFHSSQLGGRNNQAVPNPTAGSPLLPKSKSFANDKDLRQG